MRALGATSRSGRAILSSSCLRGATPTSRSGGDAQLVDERRHVRPPAELAETREARLGAPPGGAALDATFLELVPRDDQDPLVAQVAVQVSEHLRDPGRS